jgi:hypothetical protein
VSRHFAIAFALVIALSALVAAMAWATAAGA